MDENAATKKDLMDLEERLKVEIAAAEARFSDSVRKAQNELIRLLENIQATNTLRLRQLEAGLINVNSATSARLEILEQ
jgi:hypothetical protein